MPPAREVSLLAREKQRRPTKAGKWIAHLHYPHATTLIKMVEGSYAVDKAGAATLEAMDTPCHVIGVMSVGGRRERDGGLISQLADVMLPHFDYKKQETTAIELPARCPSPVLPGERDNTRSKLPDVNSVAVAADMHVAVVDYLPALLCCPCGRPDCARHILLTGFGSNQHETVQADVAIVAPALFINAVTILDTASTNVDSLLRQLAPFVHAGEYLLQDDPEGLLSAAPGLDARRDVDGNPPGSEECIPQDQREQNVTLGRLWVRCRFTHLDRAEAGFILHFNPF